MNIFKYLIILIFLAGCTPGITEGYVFKKEFKPSSSGWKNERKFKSRRRVTTSTIQTFKVQYPDRWVIRIHAANPKNAKDTARFFVTEEVYNQTEVGDQFVFDPTKGTIKEPYKRLNVIRK